MRIFIADSDGGYRQPSRILGQFVDNLAEWTGAREAVRVQWPTPGKVNPRRSHTWESAAAAGVADVSRLVRLHPSDPLVLIGVCSGTRVIYDWMDAHPEDLDRVVAVGMMKMTTGDDSPLRQGAGTGSRFDLVDTEALQRRNF